MGVGAPADSAHGRGILDLVLAAIRRVNKTLHYLAGATIIVLMLAIVANVLGRQFFRSPVRGTVELTEMAMVVMVYLGFAYAEHQGDHISVDIAYNYLPRLIQNILSVVNGLFATVVIGLVAWRLSDFAGVLERGGYVTQILRLPQAPVAWIGVVGAIAYILAILSNVVIAIRSARSGAP